VTDNDIRYAIEHSGFDATQINTGDAKGVDASVRRFIERWHKSGCEIFTANWGTYGKKAGPLRNERMMRNSDALIAFVRVGQVVTPGTASSIAEAVVKGIPIFITKVRGA
jgi:hypothetical protein